MDEIGSIPSKKKNYTTAKKIVEKGAEKNIKI